MYDATDEVIELVEKGYSCIANGDKIRAEKYFLAASESEKNYGIYCYFLFMKTENRLEEIPTLFEQLVDKKFPPALVRKAVEKFKVDHDLSNDPQLINDLESVAAAGHIVAKRILLSNEMVNKPIYLWLPLLVRIWRFSFLEREIENDTNITNRRTWY